jgi:hypothetical protein
VKILTRADWPAHRFFLELKMTAQSQTHFTPITPESDETELTIDLSAISLSLKSGIVRRRISQPPANDAVIEAKKLISMICYGVPVARFNKEESNRIAAHLTTDFIFDSLRELNDERFAPMMNAFDYVIDWAETNCENWQELIVRLKTRRWRYVMGLIMEAFAAIVKNQLAEKITTTLSLKLKPSSTSASSESGMGHSDFTELERAFEAPFIDPNNAVKFNLLSKISKNAAKWKRSEYHAPFTSIIQSSGSGKSRTVYECGDNCWLFFLCFRPIGSSGYPHRSFAADYLSASALRLIEVQQCTSGSRVGKTDQKVLAVYIPLFS